MKKYDSFDDSELSFMVYEGDEKAFDAIFRKHGELVEKVVNKYFRVGSNGIYKSLTGGPLERIPEICSEVWLSIFEGLTKRPLEHKKSNSLARYIYTIAKNTTLSVLKESTKNRLKNSLYLSNQFESLEELVDEFQFGLEESILILSEGSSDDFNNMKELLIHLEGKDKQFFEDYLNAQIEKFDKEGDSENIRPYNNVEISKILSLSLSTVKNRIKSIKENFKNIK